MLTIFGIETINKNTNGYKDSFTYIYIYIYIYIYKAFKLFFCHHHQTQAPSYR